MNQDIIPGKKEATISLVLGICGICISILGVILGPIGLYYASQSAKLGHDSGIRTGGYICSIVALILGIIALVGCACYGCAMCAVLAEYGTM